MCFPTSRDPASTQCLYNKLDRFVWAEPFTLSIFCNENILYNQPQIFGEPTTKVPTLILKCHIYDKCVEVYKVETLFEINTFGNRNISMYTHLVMILYIVMIRMCERCYLVSIKELYNLNQSWFYKPRFRLTGFAFKSLACYKSVEYQSNSIAE